MADRLSDRKHSGQNQSGVMTRSADGFSTNGGSQKQQRSEPSLPGSIPLVPQPVDCPKQQRGSASPKVVPLPDGVDRATPGIGKAWAWFLECDADGSGLLEFPELCILTKRIGLNWGKSRIRKAYEDMNVSTPFASREGVTFQDFATWWGRYEAQRRRDVGRIVKELFTHAGAFLYKNEDSSIGNEDSSDFSIENEDSSIENGDFYADEDCSGILSFQDFQGLIQKANHDKALQRHVRMQPIIPHLTSPELALDSQQ